MADSERLQELVADVAAAYFSNSHVSPADIPSVIQQIASSLAAVKSGPEPAETEPAAEAPDQQPAPKRMHAMQVKKSITPDALISFEDGKSYKTLRRHLSTRGLSPEQYREKWGLPVDYPMVSPNYSATRSAMAKSIGLGQLRQQRASAPAAARGRPPKKST